MNFHFAFFIPEKFISVYQFLVWFWKI